MSDLQRQKSEIFEYVKSRLGGNLVDVELNPEDYEQAYTQAILIYRQRAQNAMEESYNFITLQQNQTEYTLPQEVMNIRQLFRRTIGFAQGPFSQSFDPFSSAILNTYLLNFNYSGGLATYDFYTQYVEQAARMFGGYINFTFNPVSKVMRIVNFPKGEGETILAWVDNLKPEITLLSDWRIQPWIRDYTLAVAKEIIGQAREKFATIAGPQGGTTLNGAQLKAEATADQERLVKELREYVDGSMPYWWVQG
jgi:hypothetical protein